LAFVDTHALRGAFVAVALERLAGVIMEQGEAFLRDGGVEFPPRAASTILLLGEHGPMSVADLAKRLDQPHQLVTQRVDLLLALRLVDRSDDPHDARRKVLRLTAKGRAQLSRLNERLAVANEAFAGLFGEIGCPLHDVALRAIAALNRSSLVERARALAVEPA
jgi:DNA-binding MarR family transcriptional regulator